MGIEWAKRRRLLIGLAYGGALGLGAFVLNWLEYRYAARMFSTEIYIVLVALGFACLGIWVGRRMTPTRKTSDFETNTAALESLAITAREHRVLELIAEGQSNKEIARTLSISPNTVKTHAAKLFGKLDASRRTEAVQKARSLALIP